MKFKVGQVWETRDGRVAKIGGVDRTAGTPFAVVGLLRDEDECNWYAGGRYLEGVDDRRDLVKLVRDVRDEPINLQLGQVWRDRQGMVRTIVEITDHPSYPVVTDAGPNYPLTLEGRAWAEGDDCVNDLIELINEGEHMSVPDGGNGTGSEPIYRVGDVWTDELSKKPFMITSLDGPDDFPIKGHVIGSRSISYRNPEELIEGPLEGEIEVVKKETGGKKNDSDKPDFSLISYTALEAMSRALMVGESKYNRHNYLQGFEVSRLVAAAMRHLTKYMGGEDLDQEDGQHHLGSVMAVCQMILDCEKAGTLTDNRRGK